MQESTWAPPRATIPTPSGWDAGSAVSMELPNRIKGRSTSQG